MGGDVFMAVTGDQFMEELRRINKQLGIVDDIEKEIKNGLKKKK